MAIKYEYRCGNCNKLLAKGDISAGAAEVKCSKCGTVNCLTSVNKAIEGAKKTIKKDS